MDSETREVISYSTMEVNVDGHQWLQVVATECGKLLGSVDLDYKPRSGSIRRLFVAPEARKRGIGSGLLKECEIWAKAASCKRIGFDVKASNAGVVTFYQKNGYSIAWEYTDGDLLMTKQLK